MRSRAAVLCAFAIPVLLAACSSSESSESGEPAGDTVDLTREKSVIQIPLVAESLKGGRRSLMSSFNDKLKAGGFKTIPDFISVDGSKTAQKIFDISSTFGDEADKLKLGVQPFTNGASPSGYQRATKTVPAICYKGDPHKVPELIMSAADTVFTEQLGVWAWKFKQEVHGVDADPESQDFKDLEIPDVWNEWRGKGDAVLLLTHMGDDGTDVESTVISKCKK